MVQKLSALPAASSQQENWLLANANVELCFSERHLVPHVPSVSHLTCACLSPRCNCHALGSTSGQCDIQTGQCECQPGVTGRHCDTCEGNHFGFGSEGCKRKSEGPGQGRWGGGCTPSLAFAFLLPLGRYSVTLLLITGEVGTFMSTLCVMKFDFCTIAYPLLLLLPFSCQIY